MKLILSVEDNFKHQGLRKKLVEELANKGISDKKVLDAMSEVPRHFFLDKAFLNQAYSNVAFQIGAGQTISQPYTVAFQTQLLKLSAGEKVLEIGTGSGFQTAILCALKTKVYSIERQRELHLSAKRILDKLSYNPKLKYGDGFKGWDAYAPFDKVIITCGAPYVPEELMNQLKVGGLMVIPVGLGDNQKMLRLTKKEDGTYSEEVFGDFSFVPMLKDTNK